MTVREEVQQRIEQDPELIRLRKKIESGKATYADTAAYSNRAGKLLGEVFSRRLPEIPLEEREPLCVELLHDRYIDINAAVDTAQRFMDEALGIHIAPQHAPFDSERGHQIGSSLRDLSKPVETLQRRAQSAPETATKSMHDDRMKAESKFRHRAGLDCRITRVAVNGCCPWCSKVAGRYVYGEEPDDIYRRHDNCDCTVTFENGRKRQDVWSKREWEAPEPGAGAGERVVLTAEQANSIMLRVGRNYSRAIDIFNDYDIPDGAPITAKDIIDNLGTSDIGREILAFLPHLPERIILDYHKIKLDIDGVPIRGEEDRGAITIYLLACDNAERAARTIIHECTHYRYNLGGSQRDECICFAQELKHKYKRNDLTYDEFKRIIKAVKDGYPNLPWRK